MNRPSRYRIELPTKPYSTVRDRLEQAIARGEDDERIARDEGVTVERVRMARVEMNRAVARGAR